VGGASRKEDIVTEVGATCDLLSAPFVTWHLLKCLLEFYWVKAASGGFFGPWRASNKLGETGWTEG